MANDFAVKILGDAMAGVMHPKTSCASAIWNWLSCNLGERMTIIVSARQRRMIRERIDR
jgi:hypothetical protein